MTMQFHWDQRYCEGDTPWDSGLPSRELLRVLEEEELPACRTLELGCGTGTNAVYLASRGFDVTAVDCSAVAIEQAVERAKQHGVRVSFVCGDVCDFEPAGGPFDFLFDRGCYHCVRREATSRFMEALARLTGSGSRYLMLAGNANEHTENGPPRVHEQEIQNELGGLFEIDWIREFRFQDPGGVEGPLGWSCWMSRRSK